MFTHRASVTREALAADVQAYLDSWLAEAEQMAERIGGLRAEAGRHYMLVKSDSWLARHHIIQEERDALLLDKQSLPRHRQHRRIHG